MNEIQHSCNWLKFSYSDEGEVSMNVAAPVNSDLGLTANELAEILKTMNLPVKIHTELLSIQAELEGIMFQIFLYDKKMLDTADTKATIAVLWAGLTPPIPEDRFHDLAEEIQASDLLLKVDVRQRSLNIKMAFILQGITVPALFYNLKYWRRSLAYAGSVLENFIEKNPAKH